MRHSSWTLFLVPLALPLLLLCLPGSMKSSSQATTDTGEVVEITREEPSASRKVPGLSLGSGEDVSGDNYEALYKD